uniref:Translocon-associated protein subunit delta n=1 Tax=Bos mutus grunniens TaxID=30521 RepID=A0A8B9Y922_BOSMU
MTEREDSRRFRHAAAALARARRSATSREGAWSRQYARTRPRRFPTPFSGAGGAAAAIFGGGRLGAWSGRRHVSTAGDVRGPPSPPAPDWLRRPLTRRASSSTPRVQANHSLFPLAENRRWRRWHLSAPWRYCCCPVSPAAQNMALYADVSGKQFPVTRGQDVGRYQVSWSLDHKAPSHTYEVRFFDEESYSLLRKAQRNNEDVSVIPPLFTVSVDHRGTWNGPWVSTEVLAAAIGLVIYYLAFSAKSHIQA